MTTVMGIDAAAGKWLAVVLDGGAYAGADLQPHVADLLERYPEASIVAIDIPIGLPVGRARPADTAAQAFVGAARAASVFRTFPLEVLRAESYAEAVATARRLHGAAISQQSWGLRMRIEEVGRIAQSDPRLVEVHPEVSFRALNGASLRYSKHSCSGVHERLDLLARAGIVLPDYLPGGARAAPDDVVDAAVAAWSAWRVAERRSKTLPEVPSSDPAFGGVIHY
jgi:predicted RNase H-like nuclease